MKKLKKIASVALALVMAMALMVPAFATNDDNTITIKDAYPGNTYTAYKILELDGAVEGAQSYKIATGWTDFFTTGYGAGTLEGMGTDKTNLTGYVTWTKDNTYDLAAFAKEALAYAEAKNITAAGTASTTSRTDDNYNVPEDVDITVNGLGWYLIDTTNGSLCSLNINAPDAVITEKNEAPSIEKTSPDMTGKQIGDTVNFTITVTAQKGAQAYVVHDKMGAGLTLNADTIAVTSPAGLEKDTDYTVTTTNLTDGCTFEVSFAQDYLNTIDTETDIVIGYNATINSSAVTEVIGNKAQLKYGDNQSTPWSQAGENPDDPDPKPSVYKFDLVKTDSSNAILPGAQFELTRDVNGTAQKVNFLKSVDGKTYTVCAAGTTGAVTTIDAGNVRIQGLGNVEYTLTETKAPTGYNELGAPVSVDLTGKVDKLAEFVDDVYVAETGVQVINYTGAELPSTGGMGTTLFYAIGGVLLAGSAILFVTKKRMGE